MKFLKSLMLIAAVALSSGPALALDIGAVDAVKQDPSPAWNVKAKKASSTVYTLTAKNGTALTGYNYGIVDVGGTSYKITGPLSVTQGACATDWGTSGTHNVFAYLSVHGTSPQLCVSDQANLRTVGSVSIGNTGYVLCPGTTSTTDALHGLGIFSLNCTGPVIGATLTDYNRNAYGQNLLTAKASGTATSATAAAALVFTVNGVASTDHCVVTPISWGTGPNYVKFAAVTANTITVTVDTAQSGGSSVIAYVCY